MRYQIGDIVEFRGYVGTVTHATEDIVDVDFGHKFGHSRYFHSEISFHTFRRGEEVEVFINGKWIRKSVEGADANMFTVNLDFYTGQAFMQPEFQATKGNYRLPQPKVQPNCECGGAKCGTTHSHWCPALSEAA